MSFLMPKPPPPQAAPPPPARTDGEVTAMAENQRRKYSGYGGRSDTMVTGGMGLGGGGRGKTALLGGGSL